MAVPDREPKRQTVAPTLHSTAPYSNEKMFFQSFFFRSMTVQARALASSISAWVNVRTLESGRPPAVP